MRWKATRGNVLVKILVHNKEKYKFESGLEIDLDRGHNYNLREDAPSIAEIIDGKGLPKGGECLIHHNSSQDSYCVFASEESNVYSLPQDMVYFYREGKGEWQTTPEFLITYRIFKKYTGFLIGIDHELVADRLYVVKGEANGENCKGKVYAVTPNSAYEIIFHEEGRPTSIIRTRSREIIAEDVELSEQIKSDKYLVGINAKDAKPLHEIQTA